MTTQPWEGLPPELAAEHEALTRRRAIAEAMLAAGQRGMPPPQQTGRFAVAQSPLAPLAQMVNAYMGQKGVREAEEGSKGLVRRNSDMTAAAVRDYQQGLNTTMPAVEAPPDEIGGGPGREATTVPKSPEERRAAIQAAMVSQIPQVRTLASADFKTLEGDRVLAQQQQFKREERAQTLQDRLEENRQKAIEGRITKAEADKRDADLKKELAQLQLEAKKDMIRMAASMRPPREEPAPVAVVGPDGKPVLVSRRDAVGRTPAKEGTSARPLPAAALKMQQEETEELNLAAGIKADLGAVQKQIDAGTLDFGLLKNAVNTGRNVVGRSTEESRNLNSFKSTLEKLRNDSLRLNKGVQTEGDAQRAWNEMIANINDKGVVTQRLAEIQRLNERAMNIRKNNIDVLRANFGHEPLDLSGQMNQQPAIGAQPGSVLRFDAQGNQVR